MSELVRLLQGASAEVDWPPAPQLAVPALEPRPRRRALVVVVLAALLALAVAFAVPSARSAILRALGLEGVSVVQVGVLPPAQERPLSAGLGARVTRARAEILLGGPVRLPSLDAPAELHLRSGVVSTVLELGEPVLLSELRTGGGAVILRKLVGESTGVEPVRVGRDEGLWISGEEHVYLAPSAPTRLAGNVLLWESDGFVYRLEGKNLSESDALRLAAEITGT
jgi:hypothetical protein